MKIFWAICILAICGFSPEQSLANSGIDCSIAEHAVHSASKLRGLEIKRSVPCKLQDRGQVETYLRNTIKEKIPAKRLEFEGRVYKVLGLIPIDYAYVDGLVTLYTEQLGGYYDPDKEYYAMAQWIPLPMQMPIAVHELTHALQDQHFSLDGLLDQVKETSDALMARSALVEGDATAVMLDYARSLAGQGPVSQEDSVSQFMLQNLTGAMVSTALHKAPPALQAILIFPYVSGLNFAHALLKAGGYPSIDKAFKNLPSTTEEILHPEVYRSGKKGFKVITAKEIAPEGKLEFEDSLGEFLISTMLGLWIPPREASRAASGWGGDRLVWVVTPEGADKLVWTVAWDSSNEAQDYFQALVKAFGKRFSKDFELDGETKALLRNTEVGDITIEHRGAEEVWLTVIPPKGLR